MSVARTLGGSCPIKPGLYHSWRNPQPIILCGRKAQPLPQSNIFSEFHFKVKTFLKHLGWFSSAVPLTIPCLSAPVIHSSAVKKFKVNKTFKRIQTLCIFSIFTWLFNYSILLLFFSISICLTLAALELTLHSRPALKSQRSACLCLLSAGIKGVYYTPLLLSSHLSFIW